MTDRRDTIVMLRAITGLGNSGMVDIDDPLTSAVNEALSCGIC
jgi:hypothetical protein